MWGRVSARSGQGLPELPRWPQSFPALRCGHSVVFCAGDGQEANDAWLSQTADSPCPDHADTLVAMRKKGRKEVVFGEQRVSPLPAGGIGLVLKAGVRVVVVRARSAGTPSLASYCFPALRFGHDASFARKTARKQTMPGSVKQPTALARTTPTRLWRCGRGHEEEYVRGAGGEAPARRR